jgi:transcriptional regulator with XRE-family HTH domain
MIGLKPATMKHEERIVEASVGQKVRELRKRRGLTLDQLANASGSSKSYIWEIENKHGKIRPSAQKLQAIAEVLGVTVAFLVSDSAEADAEDEAFFRKYSLLSADAKARVRAMVDIWTGGAS